MKKKTIYIVFSVLFICIISTISLIIVLKNPVKKHTKEFLSLLSHNNLDYKEYLTDESKTSLFLDIYKRNLIPTNYNVTRINKIDDSNYKVFVRFFSDSRELSTMPLTFTKTHAGWKITALPQAIEVKASLIVSSDTDTPNIIINHLGVNVNCVNTTNKHVQEGCAYSFIIIEDNIVKLKPLKKITAKKIMSVDKNQIELMYNKNYTFNKLNIYKKVNGSFIALSSSSIPSGYTNSTIYTSDDGTQSILVVSDKNNNRNVRVVINKKNYQGLLHQRVQLKCSSTCTIQSLIDPFMLRVSKNDIVEFRNKNNSVDIYINNSKAVTTSNRIYAKSTEGNFLIKNLNSKSEYSGVIEVSPQNEGFYIVNELTLENYLYHVVPAEMPVSFGIEALKVQAIAARCYAIRYMNNTVYSKYGAHVEDSTLSQVYRPDVLDKTVINAVDSTKGIVAIHNNQVIDACFCSTSCGYTANADETWPDKGIFPGKSTPYLVALPQFNGDVSDLDVEKNFHNFITRTDWDGYDKYSPYYRWTVSLKKEQLEESLKHTLSTLQKLQPQLVLTKDKIGQFKQLPIDSDNIGKLLNVEVIKRGEGGNLMIIDIITTNNIFRIKKGLNIRKVLKPINYLDKSPITLHLSDNSTRDNFNLLPSSFASITIIRNNSGEIESIDIVGGGFGHGVGLSQYGAYGLSVQGWNYKKIISHYYPDTTLIKLY